MDYKLPPLPSTLGEVLQVLSRESSVPSADELVEIIRKDPAVSLYILRQVNSPYYGIRRTITQLDHAVTLLGLKRICNLVLTVALKNTFSFLEDQAAVQVYQHIMKTSVAAAALSRDLADHLNIHFSETAFTAGLLHQLGKMVFLYSSPEKYVPLWYGESPTHSSSPMASPSLEAEKTIFQVDYSVLGATTLTEWGLPEEFSTIIGSLHHPNTVEEPHLQEVTYLVAAGSAVSVDLFDEPKEEMNGSTHGIRGEVVELANQHQIEPTDVADYLDTKEGDVRNFAQAVLGDL